MFCKNALLKNFPKTLNFYKNETTAQKFSRELCDIFKNIYIVEHLQTTASGSNHKLKSPRLFSTEKKTMENVKIVDPINRIERTKYALTSKTAVF